MITFKQPADTNRMLEKIPPELSILPLRNIVAFPFIMLPLSIGIARSVRLIEDALKGDHLIGLIASKDGTIEEPVPGQIYEVGTVAKVHHAIRSHEEPMHVVVEGIERFRVKHWLGSEPYLRARTELFPDTIEPGLELDVLVRSLREIFWCPGSSRQTGCAKEKSYSPKTLCARLFRITPESPECVLWSVRSARFAAKSS